MNASFALLALAALVVPAAGGAPEASESELLPKAQAAPVAAPVSASDAFDRIDPSEDPIAAQVRIERQVTIRIAPAGPRHSTFAQRAPLPRLSERKMGKCLPIAAIAAVQPHEDGKLLLFMRDHRLVSASLEKACSARDFYAGFYIERTGDGMLCVDRDKLHSRAGANCGVSRMRQLVTADD